MGCYRPIRAFRGYRGDVYVGTIRRDDRDECLRLACGKCVGCKLDKGQSWAIRCMHESKLWEQNCFVTLTYDDEHLPVDNSLEYRDVQLFLKKLRKRFAGNDVSPDGRRPIRFFCSGEYGSDTGRAHYHVLMFNFDFAKKHKVTKDLYESDDLNDLWNMGYASVGRVTPASAAYVSQYALKKVLGRDSEMAYVDPWTGSIRKKEFCVMSRRPGIGYWWYERYKSDFLPRDAVIYNGRRVRVPRFYGEKFGEEYPELYEEVKEVRKLRALEVPYEDRELGKLLIKEEVRLRSLELFNKRGL